MIIWIVVWFQAGDVIMLDLLHSHISLKHWLSHAPTRFLWKHYYILVIHQLPSTAYKITGKPVSTPECWKQCHSVVLHAHTHTKKHARFRWNWPGSGYRPVRLFVCLCKWLELIVRLHEPKLADTAITGANVFGVTWDTRHGDTSKYKYAARHSVDNNPVAFLMQTDSNRRQRTIALVDSRCTRHVLNVTGGDSEIGVCVYVPLLSPPLERDKDVTMMLSLACIWMTSRHTKQISK